MEKVIFLEEGNPNPDLDDHSGQDNDEMYSLQTNRSSHGLTVIKIISIKIWLHGRQTTSIKPPIC
jgi:hypothetical protein